MVVMQDHRKCPKALGNNFVFPEIGLEKNLRLKNEKSEKNSSHQSWISVGLWYSQ